MSGQATPINYARLSGIYKSELPGTIIFAAVYAILFVFNLVRSIRHPTYVLIILSVFCIIRVTAFTMRAIMSGSGTAGQNLNLFVAEGVIYSAGFFGLLYSAYTLVLDRERMTAGGRDDAQGAFGMLRRLMRNKHLIRIVLMVAVALGITGGVKAASSSLSDQSDAVTFRRASVAIFLVVCCLLLIITAQLAFEEQAADKDYAAPVGRKYRMFVLLAIAGLCVVREAFFVATVNDTKQANNAHLWYPLSALPELLAVMLFATPGLVPSRAEIEREANAKVASPAETYRLQPPY